MKKTQLLLYCIVSIVVCTHITCKKDKHKDPVEQLPPETQTGANTFGCLVDGKVFKPGKGSLSGGSLNSIYQYIIINTPSGYTFGVSAKNKDDACLYKTIGFGFDSVMITPRVYPLHYRKNGQGGAVYQELPCNQQYKEYITNAGVIGELNLKKFDEINQIASGTFWFNAVNENGILLK